KHCRLRGMHRGRMRIQRGCEYVMRYFAIRSLEQGKLRPTREETGRTGFIVRDVTFFVGEDDSVGGAQGRKAQGVRGSPRGKRKGGHGRREVRAQTVIEGSRPGVFAIRFYQPLVGFGQGGEDLRRGGPCVVTEETQFSVSLLYSPAERPGAKGEKDEGGR